MNTHLVSNSFPKIQAEERINSVEVESVDIASEQERFTRELETAAEEDWIEEDDDILEQLDEEAMKNIEEEAGNIREDSIIDNYLKSIQDRIKMENKGQQRRSKPPKEYQNGTFWVQKKNPAFILNGQLELNPDQLYYPRVFLWFPHFLVSELKCPRCSTPTTFHVKEWNSNPRARRIIDLNE